MIVSIGGLTAASSQAPVFVDHILTTTAEGAVDVFPADVDGDGDRDILSASRNDDTVAWYENDGDRPPSFTTHIITTDVDRPQTVFGADVDGDGDRDVLSVSRTDQAVMWFENDGNSDPSFTPHTITTDAWGPWDVFAADVDGDGDTDVLSAARWDDEVAWYENDGTKTPSFTAHTITTDADGARSVFAADVDGDGGTDIMSASQNDGTVAWYENDGTKTPSFTAHTITTDADGARSVFAADVDGDGEKDVLSASYSEGNRKVNWYENDGSITPSFDTHTITTGGSPHDVFAEDLDGDGDTDVLSANRGGDEVAWHENDGRDDPSFISRTVAADLNSPRGVSAADIDGDDDVDALSATYIDEKIAWHENMVPQSFEGSTSVSKAPQCASSSDGCPASTLGYTNATAGGGTEPSWVSFDLGDMASHGQVDCEAADCSFWLDIAANVSGEALPVEDGDTLQIATVSTIEDDQRHTIGNVTAVARVDETETPSTWLEDIHAPAIPSEVFEGDGSLQLLLIEPLRDHPGLDPWSVEIKEAQVQLVAPPTVVVHGWDWKPHKLDYGNEVPAWEPDLAFDMRLRAYTRFGQDPWEWAGADGFTTFAYDNKESFRNASQGALFQAVLGTREKASFSGPVDILSKSMGGLVSRYLVQPEQGLNESDIVRKMVTIGTPHHGSEWADRYTRSLDQGTKKTTAEASPFGDGLAFYVGNDREEVGSYDGTKFQDWRNWWNPGIEANRHFDNRSFLADFELKTLEENRVLQLLNLEKQVPGVEPFYLAGRQTYGIGDWSVTTRTLDGDGIVDVSSATREGDTPACSDVVEIDTGISGAVKILHSFLTEEEAVRERSFAFLSGTGPSACEGASAASTDAVSDEPQAPSLQERTRVLTPKDDGGSPAASNTSASHLEFSWNVTSATKALFKAQGLNSSLEGLTAQLVAPNGTTVSPDMPDEPWFEWVRTSGQGFGDEVWAVVNDPGEGEWRLTLSGETDEPRVFIGSSELDSHLRLERHFANQASVGESLPVRVAFVNDSTPQLGAHVVGEILDPTLNETTQLDLRDDGNGPDEHADDGVYAASYRPLTPGHHPVTIEATIEGDERVLETSLPVVIDDRFVDRSCLQLVLNPGDAKGPSAPSHAALRSCLEQQAEDASSEVGN